MAASDSPAAGEASEWVVLASFENRRAAERMLFSLKRGFRKSARKGHATAFIVSGNSDGSLKLTESRVLEAGDFISTLLHIATSWMVGFMGTISTVKGVKAGAHAARARQSHAGSDDERAHAILAEAGPNAAVTLVRCEDRELAETVAAPVVAGARYCWHGPLGEFLAGLEPDGRNDWVRAALNPPSSPAS